MAEFSDVLKSKNFAGIRSARQRLTQHSPSNGQNDKSERESRSVKACFVEFRFVHGIFKFFEEPRTSAGRAVLLRIEQLSEARILLQEGEVFIVARVIAVGGAQLDGQLQIGERGIGLAGEAIESGKRIDNMIGFGRLLAGFLQAFAGFVPAAEIHHGDAALVVLLGGAGRLLLGRLHALLGNLDVHARAVRKLLAGTFENLFKFLLGALKFLLVKEGKRFVIELELRLHARINELDAASLRRVSR